MKICLSIILISLCTVVGFGQNYQNAEKDVGADIVTVTAVKSNLRDFPSTTAKVITSYPKETRLVLVSRNETEGWYEVANIYTLEKGWMHKSTIQAFFTNFRNDCRTQTVEVSLPVVKIPKPITTVVQKDDGSSPFSSEYVGEDFPATIEIENKTDKTLNLLFGGVKYTISGGQKQSITVEGGTYAFTATASGVRSLIGQKGFAKGYRYEWVFTIITRTVPR